MGWVPAPAIPSQRRLLEYVSLTPKKQKPGFHGAQKKARWTPEMAPRLANEQDTFFPKMYLALDTHLDSNMARGGAIWEHFCSQNVYKVSHEGPPNRQDGPRKWPQDWPRSKIHFFYKCILLWSPIWALKWPVEASFGNTADAKMCPKGHKVAHGGSQRRQDGLQKWSLDGPRSKIHFFQKCILLGTPTWVLKWPVEASFGNTSNPKMYPRGHKVAHGGFPQKAQ